MFVYLTVYLKKMAAISTTVVVLLRTSQTLANGEHAVRLCVTKNRVRKYVSLGFTCSLKQWDMKTNLPRKSHPDKQVLDSIISKAIRECKDKVIEFQHEGKDYTPDVLLSETKTTAKKTTVFDYFKLKIDMLKNARQIGNAKVYNDTLSQLKTFVKKKDLTFSQLDYSFLLSLENHFKAKGLTDNAMSVRFRTIRAVFNSAIDENYTRKELYPFEKFKISERFSTKTKKRAITKGEMLKIADMIFDKQSVAYEAQQFFLFSYYGQGINFVDIANLKWSNLTNGRIYYKRAKTGGELSFLLPAPALEIIEHWKPLTKNLTNTYIFPILNELTHVTPTQKYNRIHKVLTRVNQDLKEIGIAAGIDTPLTSYVARHTFATVLKQTGVSTAIISESMGHQTEAITQTYLKDFENSIIDEAMKNLL